MSTMSKIMYFMRGFLGVPKEIGSVTTPTSSLTTSSGCSCTFTLTILDEGLLYFDYSVGMPFIILFYSNIGVYFLHSYLKSCP
jgi:hypothetical protein